jgi:lysophospholipase L1-like esterase
VLLLGAAACVTASVAGPLKIWSVTAGAGRPVSSDRPAASGLAADTSASLLPRVAAAQRLAASPAVGTSSSSSAASSGALRVVGLGDSVPAGSACECTSFVNLVADETGRRAGRAVTVENLAGSGLVTSDVTAGLGDPGTAASVASADLVIITVGANDLEESTLDDAAGGSDTVAASSLPAYQQAMSRQRADLSALLDRVNALRSGRSGGAGGAGRVVVTGYWNVFLDGPAAQQRGAGYVSGSNDLTVADNAVIAGEAAAHGDLYVDLYTPFKGTGHLVDASLLAPDGDHPSAAGHQLIARTVLDALSPVTSS